VHVLVTGASSGLGQHFALCLAGQGAKVTLAARREQALAATVAAIREAGGAAEAVVMDVGNAASVARGIEEAEQGFGPVGVLVNNAGVTETGPALDLTERGWDQVLDTNLRGAWLVAQQTARRMVHHNLAGSIVNVASILGLRVASGVVAYAVSKAGLVQLTKALALEWARFRIRVNALAPGYIETEMNRAFFATPAGQAMIKRIPQRRLGMAHELDGALLLLASEAGSFMTGSIVTVDGGHLVSGL